MDLPAWAIWVVVAVAMLAIEATTSSFFTIYFAVSAAIVAVLTLLGIPVAFQIIAFGLLGVGTLVLTRPALLRIAGTDTPAVPSGVDAMRGRIGRRHHRDRRARSRARSSWAARPGRPAATSSTNRSPLGTRIEVVEIKGVTALVIAAPDDRTELPKET